MSYTKEELSQMSPAERQKCVREMQQQFGEEVKTVGMSLRSSRSDLCYASPNKKHALDK